MKRIISLIFISILGFYCFSEQKIKIYDTDRYCFGKDVYLHFNNTEGIKYEINEELNNGWKIISITPLNGVRNGYTITESVIVVYEK